MNPAPTCIGPERTRRVGTCTCSGPDPRGRGLPVAGGHRREVRGVWLDAGPHVREWDGRDDHGRAAASGLYLYRLIAAEGLRVGKIALIR